VADYDNRRILGVVISIKMCAPQGTAACGNILTTAYDICCKTAFYLLDFETRLFEFHNGFAKKREIDLVKEKL
jgi:hypothetical protein